MIRVFKLTLIRWRSNSYFEYEAIESNRIVVLSYSFRQLLRSNQYRVMWFLSRQTLIRPTQYWMQNNRLVDKLGCVTVYGEDGHWLFTASCGMRAKWPSDHPWPHLKYANFQSVPCLPISPWWSLAANNITPLIKTSTSE